MGAVSDWPEVDSDSSLVRTIAISSIFFSKV